MRVLITGITGFVGSNLARYLAADKEMEIYGLVRAGSAVDKLADVPVKRFFQINELEDCQVDAVVHAIGKAHDLKKQAPDHEYYKINQYLTQDIYDWYLGSEASRFIYLSSVKAVKDQAKEVIDESVVPEPKDAYGKSKLLAEQYILSTDRAYDYILRPCIIHGPGNQGNLNLLYNFLSKKIPYPLGAFDNKRSFLSIDNLSFVIHQLLTGQVAGGLYHVADDEALSTVEVVRLMGAATGKKPVILKAPASLIKSIARAGDFTGLPLNSERLRKLTEDYIVSNQKIKEAIGKPLPLSAAEGLKKTFSSFG